MWLKYLTYITLLISVISLWLPVKGKFKPWQLFLSISLVLSFVSNIANLFAILAILLFFYLVFSYHKSSTKLKYVLWSLVFILGLMLELHLIPGFDNLLVLDKIQFTPDALPFTLYLNLDKTIVGLIIIGLTLDLASTCSELKILLLQVSYRLPIILLVIIVLSIAFEYIKFAPKIPQNLWIWVINNLFFTCVAEEGLFRGFFQESLSQLKYKYSKDITILIPALFFGVMHYPGGLKYVILATVAGALYGWIYKVTKRIEASILVHFMLNLTHILLFTYPAVNKL
ncbi:CPBP family intramembrane glutamic endopeptidase [Rickettsia endosymbiont of Oedothorax gibbosus]|uniref:CPBP family intramembrane glutamic endopeptidase n=1 Tax=Rickettsia endosymbiont of Oedothorax gibbosus TaxID=931099 RepID=UPI002023D639|nr:CPBP family intramembrane glutamic endopeptidase [Rickettsia endosymbiont of Oedothorax gibbosus]